MPAVHSSDCTTSAVVDCPAKSWCRWATETLPRVRSRTALMTVVTGWWLAKARNQLGMVEVGTNALEAKVSGKITGKVAALTACELLAYNPTRAQRNEVASTKARSTPKPRTSPGTLWGRKPT